MSRTSELRKLIKTKLNGIQGATYHRRSSDNAEYPYKVFSLQQVNRSNPGRFDFDLCIDVWDRGKDPKTVETIADGILDLFNQANLPQATILPTIFPENSYPVDDEDKEIIHQQLHFSIQLYDKGE